MTEPLGGVSRFLSELKRRKVYRVAVAYAAVAFVGFEAAQMLVPATRLPAWADELLLVFLVAGFPVALVLAWAFEVTPEGVRRTPSLEEGVPGAAEPERDRAPSSARSSGPALALKALVGVGLLAGAVAAGWYLTGGGGEPEPGLGERSIAVLPFANLSGTEEAEPFARGIHDDLLTRLSNVSDLQVVSRTAVERYRGSDLTTGAIAEELGVRWVMEGGVERLGDRIQVNAQLIDPRTETHAWADSYRRELTAEDLFALQSEIAKRIARSLEARLTPEEVERVERRPTEDLEAYRLYVEGRTHLDRRTEEGVRRGMELFERAIARDSSYALGWSGLADARTLLAFYGYAPPDTMQPRALEAARRAVALDPALAEAHASLGIAYRNYLRDGPAALRELERAVELRPSYARAHHWLGNHESTLGRPERALEHLRRATELEPHSPPLQAAISWTHWWLEGAGERALDHARRAVELEPGYAHAHAVEALILSAAGRHEEAIAGFRRALEGAPAGSWDWAISLAGLGTTHARAGEAALAREMLERLERGGDTSYMEAMIHAALGQQAEALRALREVEWTGLNVWALRFMPVFDPLRGDSRFERLVREVNVEWALAPDGSLPPRGGEASGSGAGTDSGSDG